MVGRYSEENNQIEYDIYPTQYRVKVFRLLFEDKIDTEKLKYQNLLS